MRLLSRTHRVFPSSGSTSVFFWPSVVHVSEFSLLIVLNEAGGCDLRSLPLLPTLEVVQSFLSCLKQAPLHLVQPGHQCRSVFIVSVLGGVHDAAKASNECLKEKGVREFRSVLTPEPFRFKDFTSK